MGNKLQLHTAMAACQITFNDDFIKTCKSLGITEKEWEILTGPKVWKGVQRPLVKKLLDNLIYGVIDTLGIGRFQVPAEYVSAIVVTFCSVPNWFPACSWLGNYHRAEEIGNFDGAVTQPTDGLEKCTPQQLFALCLEIAAGDEFKTLARRFADKSEIALGCLNGAIPDEKKKGQ